MKKYYTSGECPRCGKRLLTSDVRGYGFTCESCDENFYTMEVKENQADLYEISIKMTTEDFTSKLDKLNSIAEKYGCVFLGHDETCWLTDFGWENGFPESSIINNFVEDIELL